MDPNSDRSPGLGLPPPSFEQGGPAFDPSQTMRHMREIAPLSAEMPSVAVPPALPTDPLPAMPPPTAVPMPVDAATDQSTVAGAATSADDSSDDLDEEWVNKAKAIVEQTKTDPYIESRELSKVKADYLKIRYNKQIKVDEDRP